MQPATQSSKPSIQDTVVEVVEDLVQDWGLDLEDGIHGDSRLVANLDFASVDVIQLCVALEEHFGRKFGFQDLLMADGSYVQDISVGQFAQFIEAKLGVATGG